MSQLMRNLIEVLTLHRRDTDDHDSGNLPPTKPRGEGAGPKGGLYWMKASSVIPIAGTCNEIVSLAGQIVMLNPNAFGLTADEIMAWLRPYGEGPYTPAAEYQQYLDGTHYDLSRVALFYKSSRIVYEMMLRSGWAWVSYDPPSRIKFALIPNAVKRQMASAAEHFPLMQIDRISITLVTSFDGLMDKYPHLSANKTLNFTRNEFRGFAGSFGGVMDWVNGKDAPASNYVYYLSNGVTNLASTQVNVKTQNGYRKRWAISFYAKPPAVPEGKVLCRVPVSVVHNLNRKNERGITGVNQKGMRVLFSDQPFSVPASMMEHFREGKWQSFA